MFDTLTDISLLCVIGTLPDYAQGLVKVFWLATGQARPRPAAGGVVAEAHA